MFLQSMNNDVMTQMFICSIKTDFLKAYRDALDDIEEK